MKCTIHMNILKWNVHMCEYIEDSHLKNNFISKSNCDFNGILFPSIFNPRLLFRTITMPQFANFWNCFTNMYVGNIDSCFFTNIYRVIFCDVFSWIFRDNITNIQLHLRWCNITAISNRDVNSVKTITWAFRRKTHRIQIFSRISIFYMLPFSVEFRHESRKQNYKVVFFLVCVNRYR